MKNRFTAFDIQSLVYELKNKIVGLRVLNVYDVDKKTYLFRFIGQNVKFVLLIESGLRIHLTEFDWPKNMMPSGFAMKLRKHLRQKRLESIEMMGIDRVIDMKFGTNEAIFHVIIELYDRGNMILTDSEGRILSLLRQKTIDETTKYVVHEMYPFHLLTLKQNFLPVEDCIKKIYRYPLEIREKQLENAGKDSKVLERECTADDEIKDKRDKSKKSPETSAFPLKKLVAVALPFLPFGQGLIEHCLVTNNIDPYLKYTVSTTNTLPGLNKPPIDELHREFAGKLDLIKNNLEMALKQAIEIFTNAATKINQGYLFYKVTTPQISDQQSELIMYEDYEPYLFAQDSFKYKRCENAEADGGDPLLYYGTDPSKRIKVFPTFNTCVDEFYSKLEAQKVDHKVEQQEKTALKKLEHVKKDHLSRKSNLQKAQEESHGKAELIELNLELVDKAMKIIQSGLAAQMKWDDLRDHVTEAKKLGDLVASRIKDLKLETNQMIMLLDDPYISEHAATNEEPDNKLGTGDQMIKRPPPKMKEIVIDLSLGSAYENAMAYYDLRKKALSKEMKTIESSGKALKSAQRKTNQLLKDFKLQMNINKTRKIYWFEKFYWFVSSENYLVIAGRDQQQNEILVKRYLKNGDLYVHADIHGASSVVIKNVKPDEPIPPKTLNETGTMALCYSSAWDAKINVGVWWVYHHQVSKTAPTGEYLTTGSFMIRGKKNYLPPLTMIMGFGILFKLDDISTETHKALLKKKASSALRSNDATLDYESSSQTYNNDNDILGGDKELEISEGSDDENAEKDDNLGKEGTSSAFPDTNIDDINLKAENDTDTILKTTNLNVRTKKYKQISGKKNKETDQKTIQINEKSDPPGSADNVPLKRGQKSKLKKIKDKYKDQDEDEKKIKMELLASSSEYNKLTKSRIKTLKNEMKQQNIKGTGAKNKVSFFDKIATDDHMNPVIDSLTVGSENEQNTNLLDENSTLDTPFNLPPRRIQKVNQINLMMKADDKEEKQTDDEMEDEAEEEEGSSNQLLQLLYSFTGDPSYQYNNNGTGNDETRPEVSNGDDPEIEISADTVLYALPVCAPYVALNGYRFKVKLIPGFTKRGKAGKAALNYFLGFASNLANSYNKSQTPFSSNIRDEFGKIVPTLSKHPLRLKDESNPYLMERALIKAIKDNDLSRNLPAKLKVYIPSGAGTSASLKSTIS